MTWKTCLTALITACLAAVLIASPALAFPPLPSSFYGTVKVNGENAAEGTLVRALIDGNLYAEGRAQLYQGDSVYTLDIKGDDPETSARDGGLEGDSVQFEIGGVLAEESAVWHGGTNVQLELTINASSALDTPSPAQAPIPTQTPINAPQGGAVTGTPQAEADNPSVQAQAAGSTNSPLLYGGGVLVLIALGFGIWRGRQNAHKS